jgi:PilZ domain-containing protein
VSERRGTQRTDLALDCVLRRRTGSTISVQTVNVGPGGMCVTTQRPLAIDEVLDFELPLAGAEHVDGRARVVRQERPNRYALRFEGLLEPTRERLQAFTESG